MWTLCECACKIVIARVQYVVLKMYVQCGVHMHVHVAQKRAKKHVTSTNSTLFINPKASFERLATWREEFIAQARIDDALNFPFMVGFLILQIHYTHNAAHESI